MTETAIPIELGDERLPPHLEAIGAKKAWRAGYRGNRGDGDDVGSWVGVAIVDSGIDTRNLYARRHLNRRPDEDYAFNETWEPDLDGYDHNRVPWGAGFGIEESRAPSTFFDEFGHGTKLACIIGARPGFDGVVGLVPRAQLFNCRVVDGDGRVDSEALGRAVEAITDGTRGRRVRVALFALDHRVWTESKIDEEVTRAILKQLADGDVLTVIAASDTPGGGLDLEEKTDHPACLGAEYDNLLIVAAHAGGRSGAEVLTSTSNFGPRTVHIAAPGRGIPSASPMAPTPVYGTSAAAALVAGAAALILGKEGGSAGEVRDRLLDLARSVDDLREKIIEGRVLDLSGLA